MSQEVMDQVRDLEAQAADSSLPQRIELLCQATRVAIEGGLPSDTIAQVYCDASQADPYDPTVYWNVGRTLTDSDIAEAIHQKISGLSGAEGGDSAWLPHHLIFAAKHLNETRGVDGKLRELTRKDSDFAEICITSEAEIIIKAYDQRTSNI